jgi:hypothetical protein
MTPQQVRRLRPGDWVRLHGKVLEPSPSGATRIEWDDGWTVAYGPNSSVWLKCERHPDYPEPDLTDAQWIDVLAREGQP